MTGQFFYIETFTGRMFTALQKLNLHLDQVTVTQGFGRCVCVASERCRQQNLETLQRDRSAVAISIKLPLRPGLQLHRLPLRPL